MFLVEELIIFSEPLNDTNSHLLTMEIYVYVTNQYKALLLYLIKSWIESGTLTVFNSLAISFLSKILTPITTKSVNLFKQRP